MLALYEYIPATSDSPTSDLSLVAACCHVIVIYTPYSDTDSTYLDSGVLQGIELNFSVAYSLGGPWR